MNPDNSVHPFVLRAAAWSWRILVIVAAVGVIGMIAAELKVVLVPLAIAAILAALLTPVVNWMTRHHIPHGVSVAITILGGIGTVAGVLTLVVNAFIDGAPALANNVTAAVDGAKAWMANGPLHLDPSRLPEITGRVTSAMHDNQSALTGHAMHGAHTATEIVAGAAVTLFALIFFLLDGRKIWEFLLRAVPSHVRAKVSSAGDAGFTALTGYSHATIIVAAVNALGIGIALLALRVPLAVPLATLVFLGSFVPLIGAVVTGTLAILVAFVSCGWLTALFALIALLAVHEAESHILQPLVTGRLVSIHPLAVMVSIAAGVVAAGMIGALLAVPALAFIDRFVRALHAPGAC